MTIMLKKITISLTILELRSKYYFDIQILESGSKYENDFTQNISIKFKILQLSSNIRITLKKMKMKPEKFESSSKYNNPVQILISH